MSAEASQQQRVETTGHLTLGERLRAERKRQGAKLVKIAAETRVGVHYLAALEHSDYDELPGEVFTKGYVRAYADFLGMDADEMTELYLGETVDRRARESIEDDEKIVREMSRVLQVAPDRSHYLMWSAVATVLLLLTVAVAWWLFAEPDAQRPETATQRPAPGGAGLTAAEKTPSAQPRGPQPTQAKPEATATPAAAAIDPPEPESARAERSALEAEAAVVAEVEAPAESPPAQVVEQPATPEPASTRSAEIVVSEFGVGRQVVNRNLVDRTDRFEEGAEVWFWTRVLGAEPGTILQHVWLHEGVEIARTSLNIGGSHWRTQSRKTLYPGSAGDWAVEVRDPAGKTLARAEFSCEAPG